MKRKLIIEKNALTVRMAILKDETFVNFYVGSLFEENIQNKIVIGQVMQVVKNLKAVFVDYGDEKNGMLHFKQIPQQLLSKVQPGYRLPVQIVKQNVGEKGHKLTAKLNFTGKYVVCLPYEPGINLSKKITDPTYREQLKTAFMGLNNPEGYGFIIRTHAMAVPLSAILADAKALIARVGQILQTKDYLSKGTVLAEEPTLIEQIFLDQLTEEGSMEVICNDEAYLENLKQDSMDYLLKEAIQWTLYQQKLSIWSTLGLYKKIEELLKRKIWLKNGGNLFIDYTEAMTIIDVNSAKAVLTKNPEKAVLSLNKEAVQEGILQILRRNLSGMILMDLVEMKRPEDKKEIYEYAKMLLEIYGEHRTKVYPLTELGLLQFSRTKKYQCLPHQLLESCTCCGLSYGLKSFLEEMMGLEEQLKHVELTEGRQPLVLEVSPDYYEKIMKYQLITRLEKAYPVSIQLVKKDFKKNKALSCQFYTK